MFVFEDFVEVRSFDSYFISHTNNGHPLFLLYHLRWTITDNQHFEPPHLVLFASVFRTCVCAREKESERKVWMPVSVELLHP